MNWLSLTETEEYLKNVDDAEALLDLFSLALFLRSAIHLKKPKEKILWSNLIHLTEAGDELLQKVRKKGNVEEDLVHCAIFAKFFHIALLIDHEKTDPSEITKVLWEMISSEEISLPYILERELYDRFNDEFASNTNRVDHLTADQSRQLLKGTSKGVFQIGKSIVGPLGFLTSAEPRWIPPMPQAPLWHCSDTGCEALHFVELQSESWGLEHSLDELRKVCRSEYGPASNWYGSLRLMAIDWRTSQERPYSDLLPCIGSCIVGRDRAVLVESALQTEHKSKLRKILSETPRSKELSDVAASVLAARMSPAEQLQLLGLIDNASLVRLIDSVIFDGRIIVAPEEVRVALIGFNIGRGFPTEISSLGVRARRKKPIVRLHRLIVDQYGKHGRLEDLDWRIRRTVERRRDTVLSTYIRTHGPQVAISDLVLHERDICESVVCDYDVLPCNDNETLGQRLLWKLGFVPPRYGSALSNLASRLAKFRSLLLTLESTESEGDKEKIREIGVNLFVSWEDVLERAIAYCAWCFGSDHFSETRFRYSRNVAVRCVPEILGEVLGDDSQVKWDRDGQNTLGVLEQYLYRLVDWCNERADLDRSNLRRDEDDLPHYVDHLDVVFPFKHKSAWADFDVREFEKISARLNDIARKIGRANLSGIRNSIDHKRRPENFPTVEELLAFTARMSEVFDLIDTHRIVPKRYWAVRNSVDRFGVGIWELQDYLGRQFELKIPSAIYQMPTPQFKKPLVIGPGHVLGRHNSPLLFTVESTGEYASYWEGYPRRRQIPPDRHETSRPESASAEDLERSNNIKEAAQN